MEFTFTNRTEYFEFVRDQILIPGVTPHYSEGVTIILVTRLTTIGEK